MADTASWNKAVLEAKKALGNSGKIPTKRMEAVLKDVVIAKKSFDGLAGLMEPMKKKNLEVQTANLKVEDGLELACQEMRQERFGLDPNKPEDDKKIDQAHKIFGGFFTEAPKEFENNLKALKSLAGIMAIRYRA